MPTWPASIPQSPEREGYSERPGNPVIRAPVDGPPLTRRRYTAAPKAYSATFLMTKAEKETFEAWFASDIESGALPYNWRERGDPASPVEQFLLTAEPQFAYVGGLWWRVAIEFIRLP